MSAPKNDEQGVRQVYRALVGAGYKVSVVDGEGEQFDHLTTEAEAIAEAMSCDDGYFVAFQNRERVGFVWFVYGNAPEEVVCDYSLSLSHVLDPLTNSWW